MSSTTLAGAFFGLVALVLLVLALSSGDEASFRLRAKPPTGPSGATANAPP